MLKILKLFVVLLLLLIVGGVVAWRYLPTYVAKTIISEKNGIGVIPVSVKQTINKKVDEIPVALKTLEQEGVKISIDDIIKIVDETRQDEITTTIAALESAKPKTTDQVIAIVLQNMDLGILEDDRVVAIAKQKIKMSDVHRGMKMIRDNGKPYVLTIPMGKETLKGILMEKQKEIEAKLNP